MKEKPGVLVRNRGQHFGCGEEQSKDHAAPGLPTVGEGWGIRPVYWVWTWACLVLLTFLGGFKAYVSGIK